MAKSNSKRINEDLMNIQESMILSQRTAERRGSLVHKGSVDTEVLENESFFNSNQRRVRIDSQISQIGSSMIFPVSPLVYKKECFKIVVEPTRSKRPEPLSLSGKVVDINKQAIQSCKHNAYNPKTQKAFNYWQERQSKKNLSKLQESQQFFNTRKKEKSCCKRTPLEYSKPSVLKPRDQLMEENASRMVKRVKS